MTSTISHEGIVSKITPEGIEVVIVSQSACAACHAKGVCGLGEAVEKIIQVPVPDAQKFYQGQRVVVEMNESEGSKAVLWGFVMPFIILMIAFFFIYFLTHNEVYAGLGSLLSLVPYYFVLHLTKNWMRKKFTFNIHPLK